MRGSLLVAGAGGFIGTQLVPRLHAAGYEVIALAPRHPALAVDIHWVDPAGLTRETYKALAAAVDGIVWLAGASTPASSAGRPLAELEYNLQPLLSLIEACANAPAKRVVFTSTGGAIYGDVHGHDAAESAPVEPKSYYSAGKAAAEAFLWAWAHERGHDVTILRPSNVYGAGQLYRPGFGIVPTSFHALTTGEPVIIRGDGSAVRDYLHVSDLIGLVAKVLVRPIVPGTAIYNASSNVPVALNDLLDVVGRIAGRPVPREYRLAPAYDVRRVVLDNTKAQKALDWRPLISLDVGLEQAWRAFA
jgi:UDP-glucose 4-epimerase